VQQARILIVEVHHRAVNADTVVVDPTDVFVQEHAHVGALIGRIILQIIVSLKERRRTDSHRHVKAPRVFMNGQSRQCGKIEAADNKAAFTRLLAARKDQFQFGERFFRGG